MWKSSPNFLCHFGNHKPFFTTQLLFIQSVHFQTWVKINQIPDVIIQTKASFLSKFCVMRNNSSLLFIAETLSAINERNTSKCTFLDFCLLTWKLTKFLMSFFKQKVSYFSKFCIMRDNSSVLFIAETLSAIDKRVLLKSKFSNFHYSHEN